MSFKIVETGLMKNYILAFTLSFIFISCLKDKTPETYFQANNEFKGAYSSITYHPFGEPEPTEKYNPDFELNVTYQDGYIEFFGNRVAIEEVEYGEELFVSKGSSGYYTVLFTEKADSMYYYKRIWSGPSGAGSIASFQGARVE